MPVNIAAEIYTDAKINGPDIIKIYPHYTLILFFNARSNIRPGKNTKNTNYG